MNENKTNINWLVSIYPTLSKKAYKIRLCEIWDLTFFIKKTNILCKNGKKWSKKPHQIRGGISSQHFTKKIENMFELMSKIWYNISS